MDICFQINVHQTGRNWRVPPIAPSVTSQCTNRPWHSTPHRHREQVETHPALNQLQRENICTIIRQSEKLTQYNKRKVSGGRVRDKGQTNMGISPRRLYGTTLTCFYFEIKLKKQERVLWAQKFSLKRHSRLLREQDPTYALCGLLKGLLRHVRISIIDVDGLGKR